MSGFTFGSNQNTSSASSGGGLFSTANSGAKPGNLFGNNSSTGSLFGGQPNNTTGGNLFGGQNTQGANAGFSFGQNKDSATGSTPSFGGFGAGANAQKTDNASSSTPTFGTFGTPAKSQAPSAAGSTTPGGPSLFGNLSTTPAGPPPSNPGLGASTGAGSNLFGAQNKTAEPAKTGGSLFGNAPSNTADTAAKTGGFSFGTGASNTAGSGSSTSAAPSGGLFGGGSATTGATAPAFSFGPKSADSSVPAAPAAPASQGLFGQNNTPASSSAAMPLFGAAAPTTSSSVSGLFGAKPAAAPSTQPSQAPAPPLFSNAQTSKPDEAPKASFSFTNPASASSASDTAAKPAFSFPSASSQAPPTSTTTASEAPKSLFGAPPAAANKPSNTGGGFTFGGGSTQSSQAAPTSTSATAPASSAPAFSFGAPKPAESTTATSAAGTAATPAAPNFNFGHSGKDTPANTTQTPAPAATTSAAATSTSGPLPPSQSRLKNKTMDEILTRWATDLTKYTKEFKGHADILALWDQKIVENSTKIDKLYVKTRTCEKQTMSVEMQLNAVEGQQAELESWLSKYEAEVDTMLEKESSNTTEVGGPDQEREKTYKLAEKLSERLEEMGGNLESMVEEVNAANAGLSKTGKADEPITQIVKILNTHLNQLQAIDNGAAVLQAKVAEAQKAARGFGYLNGHNGDGTAAVDDFYRSYMGRR